MRRSWAGRLATAGDSSSSKHSWEGRVVVDDPEGGDSDSDDEQPQEEPPKPPTPGQSLVQHMMDLYLMRKISAQEFCVAMWYSKEGGIAEARPYAFRPGASTGHYQRYLKDALPTFQEKDLLYTVPLPSWNAKEMHRDVHSLQVLNPHEILPQEFEDNPTMRSDLASKISEGRLPRIYHEHKIVREAAERGLPPPVPLSVFIDGVPYSHGDSAVGYWVINCITGSRLLATVVRKCLTCTCGCKGWCTHQAVLGWLHWSLKICAEGSYPSRRHDGDMFCAQEDHRRSLSGQRLPCQFAVLYIKTDWAENSGTLALPNWKDGTRPCFLCASSIENMYSMEGLSPVASPWIENRADDYFAACNRSERPVRVVSAQQHEEILDKLRYDKRPQGGRGRCLVQPIPALGLEPGDRLTEGAGLGDIGKLEERRRFPLDLVFWRPSTETLTRHRNPLFDREIGILPSHSLMVDSLHCLFLGVVLVFCREVLWHLLAEAGIWGQHGNMDEQVANGVLLIRHELEAFYKRWDKANPMNKCTRVSRFGTKHIGKSSERTLKTKGHATYGILLWLHEVLQGKGDLKDAWSVKISRAASALVRMLETWATAGPVLSPSQIQASFDFWNVFCNNTEEYEPMMIPKRHLTCHLLRGLELCGNPRNHANWEDESLNRTLKQACQKISQSTFEVSVLLRMRTILSTRGKKRPFE